jgi:DNA-binding SARP family transcriptional activator
VLEIKLLGLPEAWLDGQLIAFSRRTSIALLAYLVLERRTHSRAFLATMLAGDSFEQQARKQLSNALVDLHRQLGDIVIATRQSVRFDRTRPYRLDVADFTTRAAESLHSPSPASLEAAIEMYRDEFMAGFSLPDSADFDMWQNAQREELRAQFLQLLRDHVEVCTREGAWTSGIVSARRILTFEPWLEETHRRLIVLLARSGQRQAALAQYQACRRVLREEVGAEPSPETVDLFNRVRSALTRPFHNLPAVVGPLVGRKDLVRLISARLVDPTCRMVTITGLGGSGKTRLALEVAHNFAAQQSPPPEQPFTDGIFFIDRSATLDELSDAARAMLVLLDTSEEPGTDAGVISELLTKAPHLKLIVTARAPLHVAAEHVLHLDGLVLPETEDEIETADASVLFLQEARRHSLDFQLRDEERPHLVQLCKMLGGLPLALVLAARWMSVLSCSMLVSELESGMGLETLDTADADLPERQRSMTRVLERALAAVPGDGRAAAQLLEVASTSFGMAGTLLADNLPHDVVSRLRFLDEHSLVRVDSARGTVDVHPLLRYIRGPTRVTGMPRLPPRTLPCR